MSWSTPIPVTAGIWDTHLIVCCLILADRSGPILPFCPCLCVSISTLHFSLFFFFNTLSLGKSFRDTAAFTSFQTAQEKTQLNVVPKPCNHAAYERDSPSKSTLWKHPWWAQNCFHWWRRTRGTIVVPLVVLSELRGNQSDFCPALRLTGRAYGTRLPGYLCMPKRVCQECGHGRWPLCISK